MNIKPDAFWIRTDPVHGRDKVVLNGETVAAIPPKATQALENYMEHSAIVSRADAGKIDITPEERAQALTAMTEWNRVFRSLMTFSAEDVLNAKPS